MSSLKRAASQRSQGAPLTGTSAATSSDAKPEEAPTPRPEAVLVSNIVNAAASRSKAKGGLSRSRSTRSSKASPTAAASASATADAEPSSAGRKSTPRRGQSTRSMGGPNAAAAENGTGSKVVARSKSARKSAKSPDGGAKTVAVQEEPQEEVPPADVASPMFPAPLKPVEPPMPAPAPEKAFAEITARRVLSVLPSGARAKVLSEVPFKSKSYHRTAAKCDPPNAVLEDGVDLRPVLAEIGNYLEAAKTHIAFVWRYRFGPSEQGRGPEQQHWRKTLELSRAAVLHDQARFALRANLSDSQTSYRAEPGLSEDGGEVPLGGALQLQFVAPALADAKSKAALKPGVEAINQQGNLKVDLETLRADVLPSIAWQSRRFSKRGSSDDPKASLEDPASLTPLLRDIDELVRLIDDTKLEVVQSYMHEDNSPPEKAAWQDTLSHGKAHVFAQKIRDAKLLPLDRVIASSAVTKNPNDIGISLRPVATAAVLQRRGSSSSKNSKSALLSGYMLFKRKQGNEKRFCTVVSGKFEYYSTHDDFSSGAEPRGVIDFADLEEVVMSAEGDLLTLRLRGEKKLQILAGEGENLEEWEKSINFQFSNPLLEDKKSGICEGHLSILRKGNRIQRFFVLKSDELQYFTSTEDRDSGVKPRGVVSLDEVSTITARMGEKTLKMTLESQKFEIAMDTDEQMKLWVNALHKLLGESLGDRFNILQPSPPSTPPTSPAASRKNSPSPRNSPKVSPKASPRNSPKNSPKNSPQASPEAGNREIRGAEATAPVSRSATANSLRSKTDSPKSSPRTTTTSRSPRAKSTGAKAGRGRGAAAAAATAALAQTEAEAAAAAAAAAGQSQAQEEPELESRRSSAVFDPEANVATLATDLTYQEAPGALSGFPRCEAAFEDPDVARESLSDLAQICCSHGGKMTIVRRYQIIKEGADHQACHRIALLQAEFVRATLVELGVDPEQLDIWAELVDDDGFDGHTFEFEEGGKKKRPVFLRSWTSEAEGVPPPRAQYAQQQRSSTPTKSKSAVTATPTPAKSVVASKKTVDELKGRRAERSSVTSWPWGDAKLSKEASEGMVQQNMLSFDPKAGVAEVLLPSQSFAQQNEVERLYKDLDSVLSTYRKKVEIVCMVPSKETRSLIRSNTSKSVSSFSSSANDAKLDRWCQQWAQNQANFFAQKLQGMGVPSDSLSTNVEEAAPGGDAEVFFCLKGSMRMSEAAMATLRPAFTAITKRGNLSFNPQTGLVTPQVDLKFKQPQYKGSKSEDPIAEPADYATTLTFINDLVELLKLFQVKVCLVGGRSVNALATSLYRVGAPQDVVSVKVQENPNGREDVGAIFYLGDLPLNVASAATEQNASASTVADEAEDSDCLCKDYFFTDLGGTPCSRYFSMSPHWLDFSAPEGGAVEGSIPTAAIEDVEVLEDGFVLRLLNTEEVTLRESPDRPANIDAWNDSWETALDRENEDPDDWPRRSKPYPSNVLATLKRLNEEPPMRNNSTNPGAATYTTSRSLVSMASTGFGNATTDRDEVRQALTGILQDSAGGGSPRNTVTSMRRGVSFYSEAAEDAATTAAAAAADPSIILLPPFALPPLKYLENNFEEKLQEVFSRCDPEGFGYITKEALVKFFLNSTLTADLFGLTEKEVGPEKREATFRAMLAQGPKEKIAWKDFLDSYSNQSEGLEIARRSLLETASGAPTLEPEEEVAPLCEGSLLVSEGTEETAKYVKLHPEIIAIFAENTDDQQVGDASSQLAGRPKKILSRDVQNISVGEDAFRIEFGGGGKEIIELRLLEADALKRSGGPPRRVTLNAETGMLKLKQDLAYERRAFGNTPELRQEPTAKFSAERTARQTLCEIAQLWHMFGKTGEPRPLTISLSQTQPPKGPERRSVSPARPTLTRGQSSLTPTAQIPTKGLLEKGVTVNCTMAALPDLEDWVRVLDSNRCELFKAEFVKLGVPEEFVEVQTTKGQSELQVFQLGIKHRHIAFSAAAGRIDFKTPVTFKRRRFNTRMSVASVPNAEFDKPPVAAAVLGEAAKLCKLYRRPVKVVHLLNVGRHDTTSSAHAQWMEDVIHRRADKLKEELVRLGVPEKLVTARVMSSEDEEAEQGFFAKTVDQFIEIDMNGGVQDDNMRELHKIWSKAFANFGKQSGEQRRMTTRASVFSGRRQDACQICFTPWEPFHELCVRCTARKPNAKLPSGFEPPNFFLQEVASPLMEQHLAAMKPGPLHTGVMAMSEKGCMVARYCLLFADKFEAYARPLDLVHGKRPTFSKAVLEIRGFDTAGLGILLNLGSRQIGFHNRTHTELRGWAEALAPVFDGCVDLRSGPKMKGWNLNGNYHGAFGRKPEPTDARNHRGRSLEELNQMPVPVFERDDRHVHEAIPERLRSPSPKRKLSWFSERALKGPKSPRPGERSNNFWINTNKSGSEAAALLHGNQGRFLLTGDMPGGDYIVHPGLAEKANVRDPKSPLASQRIVEPGFSKVTGERNVLNLGPGIEDSCKWSKPNVQDFLASRENSPERVSTPQPSSPRQGPDSSRPTLERVSTQSAPPASQRWNSPFSSVNHRGGGGGGAGPTNPLPMPPGFS